LKFNPNQVTFAQGAVRVEGVVRKRGIDLSKKIMTSRDPDAKRLTAALPVTNVPHGFTKHQLPFVLQDSQLFITHAPAGAKVGEHSHDEGDGIRFIAQGSVTYNGVELTEGDWMYIPKGVPYNITIGDRGATMCYCYCCCCAGLEDVRDWIVDPAINK